MSQRLDQRSSNKHDALQNLSIFYTWKNIRKQYIDNKHKIKASTWNNESELPVGSCSVLDIQVYTKYIIKKYETLTKIPPSHRLIFNPFRTAKPAKDSNYRCLKLKTQVKFHGSFPAGWTSEGKTCARAELSTLGTAHKLHHILERIKIKDGYMRQLETPETTITTSEFGGAKKINRQNKKWRKSTKPWGRSSSFSPM